MYWADKITQSKPIKSQKLFEGGDFSVVHLSAAVLEHAGEGRIKLVGKLGKGDDIILASLSRSNDTAKLDFYINCTQAVTLSVVGGNDKTEVHLSGYFEPNGEEADDDMFYGEEAEEGEDDLDEDEEEDFDPKAALTKSLKQAKINSNKNASNKIKGSDSDDESDVVSEEDDEEDSSEELPVVPPKHKAAPAKAAPAAPPAATKGKVVVDSDDESDEDIEEDLSADDDDELVDDISDDEGDSDEEEADLRQIMKKSSEMQQRLKAEEDAKAKAVAAKPQQKPQQQKP